MMNFLALALVLTSVVTAGLFSPTPQPKPREDVIVKEGHRVVVVEYEKDDGNTKVSISPQNEKGFVANANEKLSEKIEGVKEGVKEEASHQGFRPRELVCDAYGKCKHKIASAFEKSKEATTEKAGEAVEKMKETVAETAHKASDKVKEVKETVKDSANEVLSKMEGAKEKTKDSTTEAVGKVKETIAETSHKASDEVQEAKETVKDSASKVMEGAKEVVAEKAKAVEEEVESARKMRKRAQKEVRELFGGVFRRGSMAPVAGVVHLMGFAAAFGMCVWMTFVWSYVLAGALPRQQFAMVQSKIYPVYFKVMGGSVGVALLGYLMGGGRRLLPASVVVVQGLNLASSMAMILMNLLWLEPRATKVMLRKEKDEGVGKEGQTTTTTTTSRGVARAGLVELSGTLQRHNSYSSFLNVLTLISLTCHLAHLAHHLHAASSCVNPM